MNKTEVIEKLAELEHDQWIYWANGMVNEVNQERYDRWEKYLVPYNELDEEAKELDRVWARKAYDIFMNELIPKNMWGE